MWRPVSTSAMGEIVSYFFGMGGWDTVKTGVSLTSSGRLGQMLTTQGELYEKRRAQGRGADCKSKQGVTGMVDGE